jgi:hypothetical protein
MAGVMKSLDTLNNTVRTLVALVVLGLVAGGLWYGYVQYHAHELAIQEKDRALAERDERINALSDELTAVQARVEQLETAVRLLKVEHRLAYLDVLDQSVDQEGKTYTDVLFTEINDQGAPIGAPRKFRLAGKDMYVAGWIVKFEDRFIESADPERGTSLFAFKNIFGNEQKPVDGSPLDAPGERPAAYGGGKPTSEFEQRIWDDFWSLAYDQDKKGELGVRSSHGAAVFIEGARKGWRYKISLRATGDLDLKEQGPVPVDP